MKLPFCPDCGARSRLTKSIHTGYVLACAKCEHSVAGHVRPEAAVKAFLWSHDRGGNQYTATDRLACGCPLSGCNHAMFEVDSEALAS